jgi:hypothetical protein
MKIYQTIVALLLISLTTGCATAKCQVTSEPTGASVFNVDFTSADPKPGPAAPSPGGEHASINDQQRRSPAYTGGVMACNVSLPNPLKHDRGPEHEGSHHENDAEQAE